MLIVAGFCNLLLFLFAGSLFASTFFRIRAERVFLISLIGNALLLYAAAAFHVAYPGFLVIFFRNDILHLVSRWTHMELFPKEFYFFNELPAHIIFSDVAVIVAASIVLCTVGALLPALRAARLEPANALRYE